MNPLIERKLPTTFQNAVDNRQLNLDTRFNSAAMLAVCMPATLAPSRLEASEGAALERGALGGGAIEEGALEGGDTAGPLVWGTPGGTLVGGTQTLNI